MQSQTSARCHSRQGHCLDARHAPVPSASPACARTFQAPAQQPARCQAHATDAPSHHQQGPPRVMPSWPARSQSHHPDTSDSARHILLRPPSRPQDSQHSPERHTDTPVPLERLRGTVLPKHLAVIMDGNARWAKQRLLPITAGHEAGVEALWQLVRDCRQLDIRALTAFAFSSENWNRPAAEVDFLMQLFENTIEARESELDEQGVRIIFIGDRSRLPKSLVARMQRAEERTANNTALLLTIAVSYSAQDDLANAARQLASQVAQGHIRPEQVDAAALQAHLSTAYVHSAVGPPDLLIRTSGEMRLSNFLLYEMAYCELHFCTALWPAFSTGSLVEALEAYAHRQRRYGIR